MLAPGLDDLRAQNGTIYATDIRKWSALWCYDAFWIYHG